MKEFECFTQYILDLSQYAKKRRSLISSGFCHRNRLRLVQETLSLRGFNTSKKGNEFFSADIVALINSRSSASAPLNRMPCSPVTVITLQGRARSSHALLSDTVTHLKLIVTHSEWRSCKQLLRTRFVVYNSLFRSVSTDLHLLAWICTTLWCNRQHLCHPAVTNVWKYIIGNR